MTASETAARPQRRAGTFTLGVVLVAAGLGMMASLFWPSLEIGWMLKASPLILVLLGAEVLFAARGGGKVKYDWLGMFLCFILVGAGLVMYAAAWAYENEVFWNAVDCGRYVNETSYRMSFGRFSGFDSHTLYLEAGDALEVKADTRSGWLEAEVSGEDGETLWEASAINGERRVEVPENGDYTILVHGQRAAGEFSFERVPAEAPETPETPEGLEELPEAGSGT